MGAAKYTTSRELFEDGAPESEANQQSAPSRFELYPTSALFPKQLLELASVPEKLYALGSVEALNTPAIAIVGARKATAYGLKCAEYFARKAAAWGVTVVSGGAIGCDMAAHRGALDAGGVTVVVLGSGADVVYPLRARALFQEVLAAKGTLISEAPWGSPPLKWAFSKRNRIIAALAKATFIVEAGLPSGTFQTADHTLALGNEVLVVPGSIFSKEFRGSNRLLAQGALPIIDDESFEDALAQLFGPKQSMFTLAGALGNLDNSVAGSTGNTGATDGTGLKAEELRLHLTVENMLADLRAQPMTVDALAQAYNKDTIELVRIISRLEIEGLLVRLRDGRYMTKPS